MRINVMHNQLRAHIDDAASRREQIAAAGCAFKLTEVTFMYPHEKTMAARDPLAVRVVAQTLFGHHNIVRLAANVGIFVFCGN